MQTIISFFNKKLSFLILFVLINIKLVGAVNFNHGTYCLFVIEDL